MSDHQIGLVHAVATCEGCDARFDYYVDATKQAGQHADETGHTLYIELGHAGRIGPGEQKLSPAFAKMLGLKPDGSDITRRAR